MAIPGHFKQVTKAPLLCFMNKKNTVLLSLSSQFLNHQKAAKTKPNQTPQAKNLHPKYKMVFITFNAVSGKGRIHLTS